MNQAPDLEEQSTRELEAGSGTRSSSMSLRIIRPPIYLAVCALALIATATFFASNAGVDLEAAVFGVYGAAGLVVWWIVRVIVDLFRFRGGSRFSPSRAAYIRSLAALPVALLISLVAVRTNLLLSARVFVSSRALQDIAADVSLPRDGNGDWVPRTAGLFQISEAEFLHGGVRFITTPCGFDECGIVFWKEGIPPKIGEDSYWHLYGPWWRWRRSW